MGKLLNWLPERRLELLIVLLLLLAFLGLIGTKQEEMRVARNMLLILMELLLPLAAGFLGAGMLAGDSALELLLTLPQPTPRTLLQRLSLVLLSSVLLGLLMQGAADGWNLVLPKKGIAQSWIWLAPLLFYLGLGSAASMIRGRVADGILAVSTLWLAGIASIEGVMRVCARTLTASCPAAIASPVLTQFRPFDPIWLPNRLLLSLLGLALLAMALYLAGREEPLVHSLDQDAKE